MVHNGEYLKLRIVEEGNIIERCSNGIFFTCYNRYKGKVFAAKPKGSLCRVRVKFDLYPKDKYDKW